MYLDQVPAAATAVLVLALALGLTPPARALQHAFQVALAPPVTPDTILRARPTASSDPAVDEADEDAPLLSSAAPSGRRDCARPPVWVTATLSLTSLVHLSWYLGCWIASLASAHPHRFPAHYYAPVGAWVYVLVRTQLFIQPTPSYDSMVLLASLLLVPLSRLVASPSHAALASAIASLLLIGASLYVQLQLPIFAYAPAVAKALGIPLQHPAEKLAQASFDRTAHKFPAPDGVCTLWQWASNSWVDPLIKIGSIPNGPGLKEANIWNVATPTLTRYLMSVWDMFPKGTSIWWRIALVNRRDLTMDLTLTTMSFLAQYAQPLVLQRVLEGVAGERAKREAYLAAAGGVLLAVATNQLDMNRFFFARRGTMRVRSQLTGEIYRKALRERSQAEEADNSLKVRTPSSRGAGVGQAVSLLAVDMQLIAIFLWHISSLYATPLEIVLALTLLYNLLGLSAFAGASVLLLAFPVQSVLLRVQLNLTRRLSAARDARMTSLSEYVSSLKALKLLALSSIFVNRIDDQRGIEMKLKLATQLASCATQFLWTLAPALVALAAFGSYTLVAGRQLTVPIAFTALNLYARLARPMRQIPSLASEIVTLRVSTARIHTFLNREEVPDGVATQAEPVEVRKLGVKDMIRCSDATFGWKVPASSNMCRPTAAQEPPSQPPHSLATYLQAKLANKKFQSYGATSSAQSANPPPPSEALTPTSAGTSASTSPDASPGTSASPSIAPDQRFELRDVTLSVDPGLTLVYGPTGSGKSMLLLALLGETRMLEGSLSTVQTKRAYVRDPDTGLTGGIAYCAQAPFLLQASIRDNILFGSPGPVDEGRYQAALRAACLLPDIGIWQDKDLQEIGEGGISLSGGQKARVALARAAYSRARTVLLDDVLAAVDAHTGAELVQTLAGPLFANRCILLATHHVPAAVCIAQRAIKLDAGRVAAQGTVTELQRAGHLPEAQILDTSLSADEDQDQDSVEKDVGENEAAVEAAAPEAVDEAVEDAVDELRARGETQDAAAAEDLQAAGNGASTPPAPPKPQQQKIVAQEVVRSGSVKFSTYAVYLQACGYSFLALVMIALLLSKLIDLGSSVWLAYWAQGGNSPHNGSVSALELQATSSVVRWLHWFTPSLVTLVMHTGEIQAQDSPLDWLPPAESTPLPYVLIYGLISLLSSLGLLTYSALCYFVAYRASRTMFRQMLSSVSRATTRWLDATPSGQILNRFAKDISSLDGGLLDTAMQVLDQGFSFFTAFGTLMAILPSFALPALALVFLYWKITGVYIKASRDCRRMDSVSRSPVYSAYGEALKGSVTIRAYSAEDALQQHVYSLADRSNAFHYAWWMCNSWLLVRVDVLGALSVFATQVLALLGAVNPGIAAIAITQASNFTLCCYWLSRRWSNLEQELTSIERVVDYLPPNIPHEPPEEIPENPPPAVWPSKQATIKFDNVWLRYDPTFDPVLKGVSFETRPGEKIGIVGTTGSGKSTCASALLRFVDPYEGSISIEGIDIRTLGIHDVRSRVSYIPQDPVLFKGTVRGNLDPFNRYSDEECLDALVRVRLARPTTAAAMAQAADETESVFRDGDDAETTKELTLDTTVNEGGSDLSHGQRQLLAMARALLSKSQIVIADEATASVDFDADQAIQQVIRHRFQDQVVLVIAHRLTTIVDFDRVLVLMHGRVVEFAPPAQLIDTPGGAFQTLAKRSGVFDTLVRMAHQQVQ